MKKPLILGAILIIVVGSVFYLSTKQKNIAVRPIKIGAVYSVTGPGSFWSEYAINAANLAVQEVNDEGGVNGQPLKIIYEDSQSDPKKGVSAFQKLVSVDNVDVVIGDVWAYLTNPLVPLSETSKKVLISPTVMDASVEGSSEYFFTMGHSVSSIRPAVGAFFARYPSSKTVGIICSKDPWGTAYTKIYEDVIGELGKKIVSKECTLDYTATYDYRAESIKIKASKPDVVLVNGVADHILIALRNAGISVPVLTDSNLVDGFENRDSVSLEQLKNAYVIDWRANDDFVKKYKEKFGRYPVLEAQNSYEIIRSIAKAFQYNPGNLLAGLKQVKYESVDGVVDFTSGTNITVNKAQAKLYMILGKGNYQEIK